MSADECEAACESEWLLSKNIDQLRQLFDTSHLAALKKLAPRESLNRFLLNVVNLRTDLAVSSLENALVAEHPMHFSKSNFVSFQSAQSALRRYCKSAHIWISTHVNDERDVDLKDQLSALHLSIQSADQLCHQNSTSFETVGSKRKQSTDETSCDSDCVAVSAICDAFTELRSRFAPIINQLIRPKITQLCQDLLSRSAPVLQLSSKNVSPQLDLDAIIATSSSSITSATPTEPHLWTVIPVYSESNASSWSYFHPRVAAEMTRQAVELQWTFKSDELDHTRSSEQLYIPHFVDLFFHNVDSVRVSGLHYLKLRSLAILSHRHSHNQQPAKPINTGVLNANLYRMLKRYQTMCSADAGSVEGTGFHAATPPAVLLQLQTQFNADSELFSSPLNCFFPSFCSAFFDVDRCFGSAGSLFHFRPQTGAFQCNPPFTEEVMSSMITHLSDLLNASESKQLALSFIVIVPHWTDPPAAFLDNLKHSSFCRRVDILKAQQHYYLSGSQHAYGRVKDVAFPAQHDTAIAVLQTSTALVQLAPTDQRMQPVLNAFRVQ